MRHDIFHQPVSLPDAASVDDWNAMCLAFLAHGATTPLHLGRLLERVPGHAGAQAIRGLFYALLGRRELMAEARDALAGAKAGEAGATGRERAFAMALEAVLGGQTRAAIAALEGILVHAPGDTLAMKLGHSLRFLLGDANGMRASVEAVMPAHGVDHAGRGYLLGCHAFALEETGDYAHAALAGRTALALAPDDAWGLHAVAHVHDMTGDSKGGLDWLAGREAAWSHCNNFRFHVWWHAALMLLDLRRFDEALATYDTHVRAERTDDYRDIANATSLLMRLELEGVEVGDRWQELADLSEARTQDGCLIFADLHYLLALTRDGRSASTARMLGRMQADAAQCESDVAARMARPGLDVGRGLEAFGAGDYHGAFAALSQARPHMAEAGGSHAQRDIFDRLTIDAGLRAGLTGPAGALLADRTARRGGREDGYAAVRRALIADAANASCSRGATA